MSAELVRHLVMSFVIGALCVSTLSVTADRFGSKLAGALGGFPATVATSLLFIGLSSSPERAAEATTVIPMLMGFYGALLALYCALVSRGLAPALAVSILAWVVLSALPVVAGPPPFAVSVLIFLLFLVGSFLVVERFLKVESSVGKRVELNLRQLAARMAAGGSVVALSVYLGAVLDEVLGGIMATFPAVTLATLIVTYQSGGDRLSSAVSKSIMVSGMINVTVYSVGVRYLYPAFGLLVGTLLGFLVACLSGFGTYLFLRSRTA